MSMVDVRTGNPVQVCFLIRTRPKRTETAHFDAIADVHGLHERPARVYHALADGDHYTKLIIGGQTPLRLYTGEFWQRRFGVYMSRASVVSSNLRFDTFSLLALVNRMTTIAVEITVQDTEEANKCTQYGMVMMIGV